MEQWNNVELSDLSKKSYTLNHQYDGPKPIGVIKSSCTGQNQNEDVVVESNGKNDNEGTNDSGNKIDSQMLQPGSNIKPKVELEDVEALARRLYGITTSDITELISYDDRNYLIKEDPNIKNPLIATHLPDGYVLKILNSLDSKKIDFVDAQNQLMLYLSKHDIQCSRPIPNLHGKLFSTEQIKGTDHVVRLLEFIPGKLFHQVPKTNYLIFQSGEYLAKLDRVLKNFKHDAYETHKTTWMLQSILKLRDFIYVLEDHTRKAIIEEIIESFESKVLPNLENLETQIIHGDYNEQNILIEQLSPDSDEYKVKGIIDFGDTSKSPILFEIGIAMTYIMLQAKSLESGGIFLAGYNSIRPISSKEKNLLKYCVAARLAQSLVFGAYTYSLDKTNEYVLYTQEEGWKLITELWREKFTVIDEIWQKTADQYLTQSVK